MCAGDSKDYNPDESAEESRILQSVVVMFQAEGAMVGCSGMRGRTTETEVEEQQQHLGADDRTVGGVDKCVRFVGP